MLIGLNIYAQNRCLICVIIRYIYQGLYKARCITAGSKGEPLSHFNVEVDLKGGYIYCYRIVFCCQLIGDGIHHRHIVYWGHGKCKIGRIPGTCIILHIHSDINSAMPVVCNNHIQRGITIPQRPIINNRCHNRRITAHRREGQCLTNICGIIYICCCHCDRRITILWC